MDLWIRVPSDTFLNASQLHLSNSLLVILQDCFLSPIMKPERSFFFFFLIRSRFWWLEIVSKLTVMSQLCNSFYIRCLLLGERKRINYYFSPKHPSGNQSSWLVRRVNLYITKLCSFLCVTGLLRILFCITLSRELAYGCSLRPFTVPWSK